MLYWIQGAAILTHRIDALLKKAKLGRDLVYNGYSDINKPGRAWIHEILLDRHRMFEHACASYVSGLRHWFCASRWQGPESKIACFWYNYTIINYLLMIFVHNYYAQPIL